MENRKDQEVSLESLVTGTPDYFIRKRYAEMKGSIQSTTNHQRTKLQYKLFGYQLRNRSEREHEERTEVMTVTRVLKTATEREPKCDEIKQEDVSKVSINRIYLPDH